MQRWCLKHLVAASIFSVGRLSFFTTNFPFWRLKMEFIHGWRGSSLNLQSWHSLVRICKKADNRHVSSCGKLLACGPVVWDSNRVAALSNNPFHKGSQESKPSGPKLPIYMTWGFLLKLPTLHFKHFPIPSWIKTCSFLFPLIFQHPSKH